MNILRKVVPGAMAGILVGLFFSILGKLGIVALLASVYTALVFPRPYLAFLIFIGSIPFAAFELAGLISLSKALGFVALLVTFFYFLVKGLRLYFDPLHVLVAGIVFFTLISVLFGSSYTDDPRYLGYALTELRRYWFVAIFYLLTFILVSNTRQIKQIMWVIVITCSLSATINVLQARYQFIIPGIEVENQVENEIMIKEHLELEKFSGTIRTIGVSTHPVESGVTLQVAFFISLFLLMSEKSPGRRLILILATFLIIPPGWMCTYARTSMVAILCTIPYIMVKLRNKLNLRTVSMAIGTIFFALTIVAFMVEIRGDNPFISRFMTVFHSPEKNITTRYKIDHLDAGVKMFQDHPLFGVGVGNYRLHYQQYLRPDHVKGGGFHPSTNSESTYINILTEMGVVGLSFFLLMLVFAMRNLLQVGKWYSQNGDSATATMVLGLEVTLWSLIIAHFGADFEILKYFWLLIGLSAATKRIMLNAKAQEFVSSGRINHPTESNI